MRSGALIKEKNNNTHIQNRHFRFSELPSMVIADSKSALQNLDFLIFKQDFRYQMPMHQSTLDLLTTKNQLHVHCLTGQGRE